MVLIFKRKTDEQKKRKKFGFFPEHKGRPGFPCGSGLPLNLPANAREAGDAGSISGSGRSPGGGNGNRLQYSCLENPMDRGAWLGMVHGATKCQTGLND